MKTQKYQITDQSLVVAVHWVRYGPYHLARLDAACKLFQTKNMTVVGLEISSTDETYLWQEKTDSTPFPRHTAFPEQTYEAISKLTMWRGVGHALNQIQPDLVAIAGYATIDAIACLMWCKVKGKKAILMTDSKADDTLRSPLKELPKNLLVKQFSAALCGGTPHKAYLKKMGMPEKKIFMGYDVVDNDYFRLQSTTVQHNPGPYRHLPGLDDELPYFLASARFVQRKNIDGLLRAYALYKQTVGTDHAWRLIILGDGEERKSLYDIVEQLGLSNVVFPGFRQINELPAYYGLAGAFIHPAHQEQWGLVVNEAMASGLPVLVSNKCGCAYDLVEDGENGFLFDSQNVEGLADLMVKVSSGEVDLAAMGQRSQEIVAHWGLERFAEELFQATGIISWENDE